MTARGVGAPLRIASLALLAVLGCSVALPTSPPPAGPTVSTTAATPAGRSPSPAAPSSDAGRAWLPLPDNPPLEGAFMGNLFSAGPGALLASGYVSRGEGLVDGAIWASTDGRSWSRLTGRPGFEDAAVGEITRGRDGTFLAVGSTCGYDCSGVRMWRSVDGVTWTPVAHDLPDTSYVTIIPGGGRWIAVGEVGLPDSSLAAWVSADGAIWLRATGMGTGPGDVRGLVATSNGYLAAGSLYPEDRSEPAVWTSADGVVWSPVPQVDGPQGLGIDALTQLNGVLTAFVRTESGIEPWTSRDGLDWNLDSGTSAVLEIGGTRSLRMTIVVEGGPGLIAFAVADTGENSAPIGVWRSADGVTWQAADDVSAFPDNAELYDGVSFGGEVLIVGRVPCSQEGCIERPSFWVSPPR